MKLAHLSDLHLGFRAYSATERGWNLRERDVAAALRSALRVLASVKPDLVVVTGDIFDHPDPPSTAFLTLSRSISRLRAHLPDVPILVIAGERDSPRNPADPGPVAVLDSVPGVEAASGAPRSVRFRDSGLHALLVPFRPASLPPFPEVSPDPLAKWNVLLIRGEPGGTEPGISIDCDEWTYIAVGGDHAVKSWGPNVWSAGSLERPLLAPWSEATEEKGFLTFDLATGEAEFHPIPGRPVVDLAPIRVGSGETESGSRRLRELVQGVPGGIGGKIVRIRLRGDISLPDEGVSAGLLAAMRRKAVHLETQLQHQWADESGRGAGSWTPMELVVPMGGAGSASIPVDSPSITLVTSASEALRGELVEALRDPAASLGPGTVPEGVATRPDARSVGRGAGPRGGAELSSLVWAGHPDPVELVRLGTDWLGVLEAGDGPAAPGEAPAEPAAAGATAPHKASIAEEGIRSMEAELANLRADSVEASGDLEAAAMEWARERQDADSRLDFYRERARELRRRIRQLESEGERAVCPTCGEALGSRLQNLLDTLRGEWEGVVQDGRWWKRRREQLDDKPEELQRMEEHALRLHVEVEEAAEALELRRERQRHGVASGEDAAAEPPVQRGAENERLHREILRAASNFLGRVTHGRIVGLRLTADGPQVVTEDGRQRPPTATEATALRLSLHLALWRCARSRGLDADGLLVWELYGDGMEDLAAGVLEILSDLCRFGTAVFFVAPPAVQERAPEMFREVVELTIDGDGRQELRRSRSGLPALELSRVRSGAGR